MRNVDVDVKAPSGPDLPNRECSSNPAVPQRPPTGTGQYGPKYQTVRNGLPGTHIRLAQHTMEKPDLPNGADPLTSSLGRSKRVRVTESATKRGASWPTRPLRVVRVVLASTSP